MLLKNFLYSQVVQDVVVRLLQRQTSIQIALQKISNLFFQQKLNHVWVAETTSFVHRVIAEFIGRVHLVFQYLRVARIVIVFHEKHLNDLKLIVLNRCHERGALIFFLGHER